MTSEDLSQRPPEAWIAKLEQLEALDEVARLVQRLVSRLIPQESARKDLFSGTWLGRPLHPALTDVVIGTWLSATLLDFLGDERAGKAADRLLAIGNVSALPTSLAGLSDWAELWGAGQRIGSIHGLGNVLAVALQTASTIARRSGSRGIGKALSLLGVAVAGGSAYLGGHLSFVRGVGVNQTAFEAPPTEWTPVMADADLPDGILTQGRAKDVRIMLLKQAAGIYALSDRCSHRGCPLHLGLVHGSAVECPCHGSIFSLTDGAVLRGPATVPAPSYEVRRHDGMVEVRRRVQTQWGRTPPETE